MHYVQQTLNVKRQPEVAAAVPVVAAVAPAPVASSSSYTIGSGLNLNVAASVHGNNNNSLHVNHSQPPPLVVLEPEWQYTDPQGSVQGPFAQENMRLWHEAGYFSVDLPIKMRHWARFHAFQTVFPDFKNAFLVNPNEPILMPALTPSLSLQQQQHLHQQQLIQQQQQQQQLQLQQQEQERERERIRKLQEQQQEQERAAQEAHRQRQLLEQEQARQEQLQAQQQALRQAHQQQQLVEQQRALLLEQQHQANALAQQQAAAAKAPVAPWANMQPGPNRAGQSSAQESLLAIQEAEQQARENELKRQAIEQSKITKVCIFLFLFSTTFTYFGCLWYVFIAGLE